MLYCHAASLKPRSHCIRRRTSTHARGRTATYGDVSRHVTVRRRRTLQMLNYRCPYRCCQCAHLRQRTATQRNMPHKSSSLFRPSPYGHALCVNPAVEINVLAYNVALVWTGFNTCRSPSLCVVENKMAADFNVEEASGIVETEVTESNDKNETVSDVTEPDCSYCYFWYFYRSCLQL